MHRNVTKNYNIKKETTICSKNIQKVSGETTKQYSIRFKK